MKPGSLYFIFLIIAGNLAIVPHSFGQTDQSQPSFGYSVAKQRLQLKLITSFVYFSMQGQLDLDSSAIMVSDGEHLPYSLYYDEDYINGPDDQIKELLKRGSYYLFKPGSNKNDLDSALPLLLTAKLEAEKKEMFISRMRRWQRLADATCSVMTRQTANAVLPKPWNLSERKTIRLFYSGPWLIVVRMQRLMIRKRKKI